MFWYIVGTLLTSVTFLMIFCTWDKINTVGKDNYAKTNTVKAVEDETGTDRVALRGYILVAASVIFNFGLSTIQITHVACLNSLTKYIKDEKLMNQTKDEFTSRGCIIVYGGAAIIFLVVTFSVE